LQTLKGFHRERRPTSKELQFHIKVCFSTMRELVAGAPCGSHTQLGRCQKTAQSNGNIHILQTNE